MSLDLHSCPNLCARITERTCSANRNMASVAADTVLAWGRRTRFKTCAPSLPVQQVVLLKACSTCERCDSALTGKLTAACAELLGMCKRGFEMFEARPGVPRQSPEYYRELAERHKQRTPVVA